MRFKNTLGWKNHAHFLLLLMVLFLPLGTGQLVMYGNAATTEDTSDNSAEDHDQHSNSVSSSSKTGGTDMILYIVFGVAVAVFILVLIIIVKILRRKNPNPNGYTLTSTGKIHFSKSFQFPRQLIFQKVRRAMKSDSLLPQMTF